ncbi:MAG: virulence factor TspB C-terminal domain-related protein [Nitrosomonas sp.]|uniref:virulence factor TspB C-terminal domain-related protein n=2 Tax=Nitrosomonas sp. TaxID=42353 RepID=UPI00276606B4|nr:virulence factor TspB C-terminal domain-related protein [Nitrosomonas sp.]MDP3662062.1 virulence factor TspB C-terminal domain-related protein [Nitrosomonas sp.]MDZ4106491.1 virulence factor TspB C-terminal domain-related protein [Nitrosomonas sp.]
MDTFKLILLPFLLFQSGFVFSQSVFDMSEHSGFIRGSDGNYVRVSANGSVRSLTSNTALAVVEKPIIQTSKGALEVTLNRAASVDLNRVGSAVAKFAKLVGPLGMAIGAAQLVCDLSNICNSGGIWTTSIPDSPEFPSSYPASEGKWQGNTPATFPNPTSVCSARAFLDLNFGADFSFDHIEFIQDGVYQCFAFRTSEPGTGAFPGTHAARLPGCADGYTLSGSNCLKNAGSSNPATDSDWSAKESSLNNSGFVPELFDKGLPIPTGTPTLTGSPVTVPIGTSTKTLKDGAGNVTGSEVTTDSLSITDGATSENPNRINLTQTTITNNYNTSNVLTSSSTTVTDPQQPKTDGIEIEIDNMQDQPLEQQAIPGIFTHTSWGSGSCPGDRSVSYHYGTLNLSFQPACDAAIALQPLVVILAGIAALFIISGAVRND